MGKAVEWDVEWMKDVAEIKAVNIRKGSEHTIEYVDKQGFINIVRVPACLSSFLYKYEDYINVVPWEKFKKNAA
jgi:hypothetical protein